MRTLSAVLTAAQKSASIDAIIKIVLTSGGTSYTYTRTRIKSITHTEEPWQQTAEVLLDNSDGTLTSLNLKGYKGVISYGVGAEYSACAPLWVIGQQFHSWRGGLACSLSLTGTPTLLSQDRANAAYTPTSEDIKTVKDLLTEVIKAVLPSRANSTVYALDALVIPAASNGYTYKCIVAGTTAGSAPTWPTLIGDTVVDGTVQWQNRGKELTVFSQAPAYTPTFDSEDSLFDVFMPKDVFSIALDASRLEVIKTLVEYTGTVLRVEADGAVHLFAPTTTGVVYNYEYKLAVAGEHTFFNKSVHHAIVIPNKVTVSSRDEDSPQYTGAATDAASYAILPKEKVYKMRLASNQQAADIALVIQARFQREAQSGSAIVPINVGAEVYDYVKITDARQNDTVVGNIAYLQRRYEPGSWEMEFRFGEIKAGGLLGTLIYATADMENAVERAAGADSATANSATQVASKAFGDVVTTQLGAWGGAINEAFKKLREEIWNSPMGIGSLWGSIRDL